MLLESALVVSIALSPAEFVPPPSPYSYRWWEEEEEDVHSSMSLDGEADKEAAFRLLIEEVARDYESAPWLRYEP